MIPPTVQQECDISTHELVDLLTLFWGEKTKSGNKRSFNVLKDSQDTEMKAVWAFMVEDLVAFIDFETMEPINRSDLLQSSMR